jgi:hypothetical protein
MSPTPTLNIHIFIWRPDSKVRVKKAVYNKVAYVLFCNKIYKEVDF